MKTTTALLALLVQDVVYARAQDNLRTCPLLGQQYPPPVGLSTEPAFQDAMDSIGAALDANATAFPYNVTSYSIGVFSVSEPGLAWEYHQTTALLANSTQGTRKVDADSVYRIGSISKLLTVYLLLVSQGDGSLSDPITKWIPELEDSNVTGRALSDWSTITIGDLAGQMGGLVRDCRLSRTLKRALTTPC